MEGGRPQYLEIQEGFLHLSFIRHKPFIGCRRGCTVLDIAMTFEIKDGKAADVADAVHMNCKLSEEINDFFAATGQTDTQHEWCEDQTHKLEQEKDHIVLEQECELLADLMGSTQTIDNR